VIAYTAVFTRVRMHRVQYVFWILRPFSQTAIIWRFGLKVRRVAFLDHGTLRPKVVRFPQLSHLAMISLPQVVIEIAGRSYHKPTAIARKAGYA
jgi:hypothetical protein